jgi:hypothetical protein
VCLPSEGMEPEVLRCFPFADLGVRAPRALTAVGACFYI